MKLDTSHQEKHTENRMLRRIGGTKRGGEKQLHNEELHKFYISTNFISLIK
jgi:hypothetical protein